MGERVVIRNGSKVHIVCSVTERQSAVAQAVVVNVVRSTLSLSFILACANIVFNIKVTVSSRCVVRCMRSPQLRIEASAVTKGS